MTQSRLNPPSQISSDYLSDVDNKEIVIEIGFRLSYFGLQYEIEGELGDLWFQVVDEFEHI